MISQEKSLKVKVLVSQSRLVATPWTVAHQGSHVYPLLGLFSLIASRCLIAFWNHDC